MSLSDSRRKNNLYMKYKVLFLLMITTCISIASPVDFAQEFTKTIERDFNITSNGIVDISNKYGKVDIHTGNVSKVEIQITITVEASSESKADEVFERIRVNFSNSADFVGAETEIRSKSNNWWGGSKESFTIDYDVRMPVGCNLNLSNKYGNSFVEELNNDASCTIKYGNIKMQNVDGDLDLVLGYGNATLQNAHDLKFDIKYANVEMRNGYTLNSTSKYSKLEFEEIMDADISSKYDTYKILKAKDIQFDGKYDNLSCKTVNNVDIDVNYTDVRIGALGGRGIFEVTYGNTSIAELGKDFKEIDYEGSYSDLTIELNQDLDAELDLESNHGDIRYPSMFTVNREIKDGSSHTVRCKSGSGGQGIIKVDLSYGDIKIR